MIARAKPSPPRKIGAVNDNAPGESLTANDDRRTVLDPDPLTRDQLKRLAKAERKMASPDPQVRAAGRRDVLQIERQREHRREIIARQRERAETRALEEARGSVIEVSERPEHKGRIRVVSRDGLELVYREQQISRAQLVAGERYRADYELTDPLRSLAPAPLDGARKISGGGEGFAKRVAMASKRVLEIEALIQADDPTYKGPNAVRPLSRIGRAVVALRAVAGEGRTVRDVAGGGSGVGPTLAALDMALEVCVAHYGLE